VKGKERKEKERNRKARKGNEYLEFCDRTNSCVPSMCYRENVGSQLNRIVGN
jgi:hypothetical protein